MSASRNLQLLTPLMDVPGALRRLGDDVELLEQIILIFLEDAPALVHSAREALSRGDALEVRRAAHSIKGMMATLGAQAGQNAAFRLEHSAAGGHLEDASTLIDDCSQQVVELAAVLKAYLGEGGEPVAPHDHASAAG
jgi:HPt (histidine-containing phosphotransfer) domain-containing protein